jgi:hypothetical protein
MSDRSSKGVGCRSSFIRGVSQTAVLYRFSSSSVAHQQFLPRSPLSRPSEHSLSASGNSDQRFLFSDVCVYPCVGSAARASHEQTTARGVAPLSQGPLKIRTGISQSVAFPSSHRLGDSGLSASLEYLPRIIFNYCVYHDRDTMIA